MLERAALRRINKEALRKFLGEVFDELVAGVAVIVHLFAPWFAVDVCR
jgi:hypothetical protein